jgi:hypothetical protein
MHIKKLTREEAKELTKRIRNTVTEFFPELEITPTMYKCDEWRESPIFHPTISIIRKNRRAVIIEINFR